MRVLAICLLAISTVSATDAYAQVKKANPSVRFVHPGADKILSDVATLFSLTNPVEQKQKRNMVDFLETFLGGVDKKGFIRIDLLFGSSGTRYLVNFPLKDLKEFRANIRGVGVDSKPKGGMYRLSDEFEGWMAFRNGYVTISEDVNDVKSAGAANAGIANLLGRGDSLTFELVNTQSGEADQKTRKQSFERTRKELLAAYKKSAKETPASFAARQQGYVNQLEELERFFVEAGRYVSGWKFDPATTSGQLYFELDAIPGTSLATAIAEFDGKPSHFAGVPRNPTSILSGRFHHPIDAMRQKALAAFFAKSKVSIQDRIQRSPKVGAGEKPSAKEFAGLAMDMMIAGLNGGMFDGFVEVTPAGANNLIMGGIKTPADMTTIATDTIKAWEGARAGQVLTPNDDKEGDITIHALKLVINNPDIQSFFGDPTVYLGVGPDTLWYAIGPNAKAELKKAIQSVGQPPAMPTANAVDIEAKMHPWMVLLDKIRATQPTPADPEGRTQRQERDSRRARILSATRNGEDQLSFKMKRVGDKMLGAFNVTKGLIRFVAKEVARFSKDNLDVN